MNVDGCPAPDDVRRSHETDTQERCFIRLWLAE